MSDVEQLQFDLAPADVLTVEEIWRLATIETLKRLSEDRRIERKSVGIHAPELAEYFSMWANTIEGGLIAVGIENKGAFSGCLRVGVDHRNELESNARNACPDARVECRQVYGINRDGVRDFILLFRVHYHETKVVRTAAGNAFIRSGESKRKLRDDEIRELESQKGQVDDEQEPCPSYTYPNDFIPELVDEFVASARDRAAYGSHLSTEEVLELRRLGKRKGDTFVPNAACVLLFASDPLLKFPGCKIRFLRHEGEIEGVGENWNAVKDIPIEGPVPVILDLAAKVLASQLREFSRLGPDGKFYTAPEYPQPAWYEAIVNACAHRSYGALKNMNVFVRMFDDRLEIESPGGFRPPVTPDNIYEMHHPRNPILMGAMQFLKYVKCAREGTRRMRQTLTALELPPPHFAQKDVLHAVVKVTLKNNVKQRVEWVDSDVTSIIGEDAAKLLSATERRAINFIYEHGTASISDIQRLLKNDWKTSQKLLHRLTAKGLLTHTRRTDIEKDPKGRFSLALPAQNGKPRPATPRG